jgi:hypothetical protein
LEKQHYYQHRLPAFLLAKIFISPHADNVPPKRPKINSAAVYYQKPLAAISS